CIRDRFSVNLDDETKRYLDKSFIYGTEFSFKIKIANSEIGWNATILNGKEEIKEDAIFKKRELTYLPKFTNFFYFNYSLFKNLNISLLNYYRTKKINYYGEKIKFLSPYFIVDFKVNYQFTRFLNLEIAIFNLFNKEYAEMFGYTIDDFDYPIGRRKIFLSLDFRPF
ncbi:MAG: TonB-dependent receptor, partial [candidate division WOR-3 bacterium]|nr:TonB-dependent receptor [candidate division WOR-3 bacterium]